MNKQTQKRVVLKRNTKNLMISLLPVVKNMVNKKINLIKSSIMKKIPPNKFKKRQNTLKRVSNRGIKSLENNFNVKATKNIINTPKIVIEKPLIVAKPEIATLPKIVIKTKKVAKPKTVNKPKVVSNKKYDEYKKRVIKQLKKLFDTKKSGYLDDDEEYKGIRDLEYLFEDDNDDNDYYRPILVKSSFNENYKKYESRGDKNKTLLVEQYLNVITPYLKE